MKLLKDGKEMWAYVASYRGDNIRIEIIEKARAEKSILTSWEILNFLMRIEHGYYYLYEYASKSKGFNIVYRPRGCDNIAFKR